MNVIYCTIMIVQAVSCNVNDKHAISRRGLSNSTDIREDSGGANRDVNSRKAPVHFECAEA